MKKRLIGGSILLLIVYSSMYFNIFSLLILLFGAIGLYELVKIYKLKNVIHNYFIFYLIYFLLGIISLISIDQLLENGVVYIFILTTMIMINDSFAYLVGKSIGKTKFSKTSPNKTVEGIIGGLLASLIVFSMYIYIVDFPMHLTSFSSLNIFVSLFIMGITLIGSIIGDLLESKLKRIYEIKDSGSIVYGHGGILDRIDSWLLGSIIYIILLALIM